MAIDNIFQGESKNLEYKERIPDRSERFVKTAIAFANGDGGSIIFGIRDETREVVGFDEADVFGIADSITNAIYDSCEPKLIPDVGVQNVDGKYIVIANIPAGMDRPYHIKAQGPMKGTYVRVSGTTREASVPQIQEMILESTNRSYDQMEAKQTVTVRQVDTLCAMMYREANRNGDSRAQRDIRKVTKGQLLSWKLLYEKDGTYSPSNGFLLLKGDAKAYPDAAIQCAVCAGTERGTYITRNEFTGPLHEQIDRAVSFVLENIHLGMRIEGSRRREFYELPPDAVRELIANAVCHRSYLSPGKVQIFLYDDRLEITSPGMLNREITIERLKMGYSNPRNRGLAAAFAYMNIIEGWGGGIPNVIRLAREYALPEPEFIAYDNDFRVNLYRRQFERATDGVPYPWERKLPDNDHVGNRVADVGDPVGNVGDRVGNVGDNIRTEIIRLISENSRISASMLAKALSVNQRTIERHIKELRESGTLMRHGSARNGSWEIIATK